MKSLLWRRLATTLAAIGAASLVGCASLDTDRTVAQKTAEARVGPKTPPFKPITGFSNGLRCMDGLLIRFGVSDVAVIVEDLADQTKKINAGTKDMLISAVSDMTRRSRAIRLVAYGQDSGNTIGFLHQALRREHYAAIPQFALRGSISQFDDTVVRRNADLGLSLGDNLTLGAANTAQASILGIDLTLLSTQDLSVLPGVGSRNSVVLFKQGKGYDGEAQIRKFGINFSLSTQTQEGQAQAVRTLVELASIELFGRLARVPYWSCIGADAADEAAQAERRDWFEAMASNPTELVAYFQHQMRTRGVYDGPVDGAVNPQIKEAVSRYREALGLSREPKLTQDFFDAYLAANHEELAARVQPVPAASSEAAPDGAVPLAKAPGAAPPPLALQIAPMDGPRFAAGDPVRVSVKPSRDAYLYCFHQDENRKVSRFFPNRFQRDARVAAGQVVQLPGAMRFEIRMNARGVPEAIGCFATERDVLRELPPALAGGDFDALPVASLDQVRQGFAQASGGVLAQEIFHVQASQP